MVFPLWAQNGPHNLQNISEQKRILRDIHQKLKQGSYFEILSLIDKKIHQPNLAGDLYYIKGICHNRLNEYQKAIEAFENSLRFGHKQKDLHYEYGQALYALKNYIQAKKSFSASIKNRYLTDSSLFYLGTISEQMNQFPLAKRYYKKIIQLNWSQTELKQSAHLGIARIYLKQAEATKRPMDFIEDYVLPEIETGIFLDKNSIMSKELVKFRFEVKKKYDLLGYRMKNGRLLPRKRYELTLSQETQYDTNVVNESDESTYRALEKKSWYSKTEFSAQYYFPYQGLLVLTPRARAYNQTYLDRDTRDIYSNDNYSLSPELELSWDHRLFSQIAWAYGVVTYNYTAKDYRGRKNKDYYASSWTYGLGEKFNLFSFGRSQIEWKKKDYQNTDRRGSSQTNSLLLSQSFSLPWEHLVIALFNADFIRYSTSSKDNNSYLTRIDYIYPDIYWEITLHPSFALTFTDTKEQSSTRGTETAYNPSLGIYRYFWQDHLKVEMVWDYLNQDSKDTVNYKYDKHQFGMNLSLSL